MTVVVTGTNMRSFWSDPYLWIHLAGLAALPLFLELCFLGLAVGDPVLPVVLEVLFVAVVGITPILWMQWQRPFCIFSLVALAIKPELLTEQQRRLLRLFKSAENQVLAGAIAIALLLLLWQLYRFAPIGTEAASMLPQTRLLGLGLAAIAFLFCNLFLQVPLSVARVMLISDAKLASITPYPVEQIAKDFTLLGLRVKQIVPPLLANEPKPPKPTTPRSRPTPPVAGTAAMVEPDALCDLSPWDEVPAIADSTADPGEVSATLAAEAIVDPLARASKPETPDPSPTLTLATILESISLESSESLESLEPGSLEPESFDAEPIETDTDERSDSA